MNDPRNPLDRRRFLARIAPVVPLALGACGWDGGRTLQPVFDRVIRLNNSLGEKLQAVRQGRVPEHQAVRGHMPAYFVSDDLPQWDGLAPWSLTVGGLVRKPATFTLEMLAQLPHVGYTVTHHCVEGWTAVTSWRGVPFQAIAAMVEPQPGARFVRFDSFDSGYSNGWDLASAMHPQTILADGHEGRPLSPEHGAPLRLYAPIKLGYKLTKYLTKITFTAERPGGYWEDRGYPWFAGL
jgi:DMSO/TMAO reductase YedYZ molybdopterin-dependent catalytic subunit